jgi:hypothetical protein
MSAFRFGGVKRDRVASQDAAEVRAWLTGAFYPGHPNTKSRRLIDMSRIS